MFIDSIHRLPHVPIAATRLLAIAIGTAVTAVAISSWWPFGGDVLAPMQVRRSKGTVSVIRDGETLSLNDAMQVEVGDVIVTGADSGATVRLEGARRGDIGERARMRIVDTSSIGNHGGDVLVTTNEPMTVKFGDVEARARDAVFRIDSGFAAARAATYRGAVSLTASGEPTLEVPRLFEAQVAGNDLPAAPRPYELRRADIWDRALLGDVIELDIELSQLGAGFDAQVGKRRPRITFFRSLSRGEPVNFMKGYLDRRSSDLLIGFHIARNTDDKLALAFKTAFELYDDGARWSIVAAIMRASFDPLVAQLDGAIAKFDLFGRNRGDGPQLVASDDADDDGVIIATAPEEGDGGETPSETRDPGDSTEPKPKPKPNPKPSPSPTCDNPIDCTVGDILPPSTP